MGDAKKYTTPTQGLGDHAHTLARAGLGSIPFVGAVASELLGLIIAPPLARRQTYLFESLGDGLRSLERDLGVVIEHLSSNDTFVDTALQAIQVALRTSQQEKLDSLRYAILNAALPNAPEASMQQIFINLVDRFTVSHIRILNFFHSPLEWFAKLGRPWPDGLDSPEHLSNADPKLVLREAYPEMVLNTEFCDLLIHELTESGLFIYRFVPVWSGTMLKREDPKSSRTTALGRQFIKFITPPILETA